MDYEDFDVMTPDDKCEHGNYKNMVCLECEVEWAKMRKADNDEEANYSAFIKKLRFKTAEKALIKMVSIRSPAGLDYPSETEIAKSAVRYADALLKELDK